MQEKYFSFQKKNKQIITIINFGSNLYSPIKPKGKRDIKDITMSNPNKMSKAKHDVIFTIIYEDANFEDTEDKASQLMNRKNIE